MLFAAHFAKEARSTNAADVGSRFELREALNTFAYVTSRNLGLRWIVHDLNLAR